MVSFSCEVCNDTIIKKKLDQHKQRCRGAYFTCIDCSTTFQGNDHKQHTQCITEDEKYQKSLYKGNGKQNNKQNGNGNGNGKSAQPPKPAPVEAKAESSAKKEAKLDVKSEKKGKKEKHGSAKLSSFVKKDSESLYGVLKRIGKEKRLDKKEVLKKLRVTATKDGEVVVSWS